MRNYQAFGKELTRLRVTRGIATQGELGKLLGVAQQTVARWEAGKSRPRAEQVGAVAKVLGADAHQLMELAGHVPERVTVSFDQPLPLASLSPEAFQRFCLSLLEALYPESSVHPLGKTGHEQFGVDIDVTLPDGTVHSFQCKRMAQFGAAKVREAVKAHSAPAARKILLLSRVASPLARQEVRRWAGWDLWDQDDLSQRLRSLPVDAKCRLVDTFFPGQRFSLLGEPNPGPWQNAKEFFAPYLVPGRPFTHLWQLVGRTKECQQLATALEKPTRLVVSLVGPAGGGKSRTLRAAIEDFTQKHRSHIVRMLSPTEPVTGKSLEDLGTRQKLLVVDDAHDRTDLDRLIHYVASPASNAQLLLVYRPYAKEAIDRELARFGLSTTPIVLEKPQKADAIALATQVLEAMGGPVHAAESIATVAYDSPLSVVVGAWIVTREGIHPELFGSHDVFQRMVLRRYRQAIEANVSTNNRDREIIGGMLRVIALLQPVVPDDPSVLALYQSIENINVSDATRLTKLLTGSGILFKRGARYRLSPDLLADSIIESEYITQQGTSNGGAERVFEASIPEHKAHALLNLSRLDWRRNQGDTSGSALLDGLWRNLRWSDDYIRADIKAALEAAHFQPRQALELARRLIADGHGGEEDVCRLIRNSAYTLRYVPDACELLWALGQNDDRQKNLNPNHPLRLLTELATPEPMKPVAYIQAVVDFMLARIREDESWLGLSTPFDVLVGALATEGHTSSATSRAVSLRAYGINHKAVAVVRQRIIDAILEGLTSNNKRHTYAAAQMLGAAIRGPIGLLNRIPTKGELDEWDEEFTETLARVNSLLDRHELSPTILLTIASSASWHAAHAQSVTKKPAEQILKHLDRDLETRVTRVLIDGWGTNTWNHAESLQEHNDSIQRALANDLVKTFPNVLDLAAFINARLLEMRGYGTGLAQSSHIFIGRLLEDNVALAETILDVFATDPETPIADFAPAALALLMRRSAQEADRRIDALLASGDSALSLVARGYAFGFHKEREISERDRVILRRIFTSIDPNVLCWTPWVFRELAPHNMQFAIDIIVNMNPEMPPANRHELFMWLHDDNVMPFNALSSNDLERILALIVDVPRLDDHWVLKFLKRISDRIPRLVVQFAKDRLSAAIDRDDWSLMPVGIYPHEKSSLDIINHSEGPALLRDVLDWAMPKIDDYRFTHHLADLVAGVFGMRHASMVAALEAWCEAGTSSHFKVLASILRDAPPEFVFVHREFVSRLLRAARALGPAEYERVRSALYASGVHGIRSGTPGEPFPQDLALKADAEQVLAKLSKGDPAHRLYDDLRKHAEHDIERQRAEGRAMAEEDEAE